MCEDSITITGEAMYNFIRDHCIHHDSYWNYFNQHIHKCRKNRLESINKAPECFPCINCKKHLYPQVKKDIKEKDNVNKYEIKICEITNVPCSHCKPVCDDWIYKENQ